MCSFWRKWDFAFSIPLFSTVFMLEVDGHKNESGKRCVGSFVEEGAMKAGSRSSVLFSVCGGKSMGFLCADQ